MRFRTFISNALNSTMINTIGLIKRIENNLIIGSYDCYLRTVDEPLIIETKNSLITINIEENADIYKVKQENINWNSSSKILQGNIRKNTEFYFLINEYEITLCFLNQVDKTQPKIEHELKLLLNSIYSVNGTIKAKLKKTDEIVLLQKIESFNQELTSKKIKEVKKRF